MALIKLRAADDERRQAKRNRLADKLTVEAKALADLKIGAQSRPICSRRHESDDFDQASGSKRRERSEPQRRMPSGFIIAFGAGLMWPRD